MSENVMAAIRSDEPPPGADRPGGDAPPWSAARPWPRTSRPRRWGGVVRTARLSLAEQPWLGDHLVLGAVLLPATALLDLAAGGAREAGCDRLDAVVFERPVPVPEWGALQLRVAVGAEDAEGRRAVTVSSRRESAGPDAPWTRHAAGRASRGGDARAAGLGGGPPPGAVPVDPGAHRVRLAALGLVHGPAFHGLRAAWAAEGEAWAEVSLPDGIEAQGFGVHPALLDAALHAVGAGGLLADEGRARVPCAASGVRVWRPGARALRVRLARVGADAVSLVAVDGADRPVVEVGALVLRPLSAAALAADRAASGPAPHRVDWQALPPPWPGPGGCDVVARRDARRRGGDVLAGALWALGLVRAWLADGERGEGRLAVVTRGGVALPGESPDPAQAAVWGLVRAAQSEHPGRLVLVDADPDEDLGAALASGEPQLAVRGGRLLVPRLVRAERVAEVPRTGPVFGPGTVLVTGAGGALGRLVARHLVAAHGVTDLLLVGRRGVPGDVVAALAGRGATVRAALCDVGERAALRALLADRPLTGVVHCAGAPESGGAVASLAPERLARALRPTALAAARLHELTRGMDLSAFVLFSSPAGILGGRGAAPHAAAGAALDALAERRRALGLPAVSIAWRPPGAGEGALPLACHEGLALMDAALTAPDAVTVPLRLDPGALRARAVEGALPALFHGLVRVPTAVSPRRVRGVPTDGPRAETPLPPAARDGGARRDQAAAPPPRRDGARADRRRRWPLR
ncbi:type I polyketide synthase [Streptomyces radicis]|uniref:KR domain-containing protein n=1 Tax=Streptomyces radicis TaxID=1750517 RepID=A0A3A9WDC7_9ACTN|nr:type I polyketide synthase [Streptomyces radicis]RKN05656.1 KR domain-containing protein [Streptomyces radicis]RKN17495.1 KR domain-containing protein [Streptomyces radicis]